MVYLGGFEVFVDARVCPRNFALEGYVPDLAVISHT
jgi:hypothetical protein